MKQDRTILKSYFEVGDFPTEAQFADLIDSFVHKDESSSAITIGSVFIDAINGDDTTAKIESKSRPFKTIDAALTAYNSEKPRTDNTIDHPYLVIHLINDGIYPWNILIPERNIIIESAYYKATVDFSNNPNLILNESAGLPFTVIVNGKFLTIKNHSENLIAHGKMNFYGECDTIDTRRAGFAGFNKAFITAGEIRIKYKLIKGYGNVFKSYGANSSNEFIGNIAAEGHLVVNNQGNGYNYFDFDIATSTGKLQFLKVSLPGKKATIHWGDCRPIVAGNFTEITNGSIEIICKPNAKSYGTFQGNLNFSGHSLEALRPLARIGSNLTITRLHLKLSMGIASFYSYHGKVTLIDSLVELNGGGLIGIETHTNFTHPILELKGHNTILHSTSGSDLVTKYHTANPTGISYKQFTAGGLKTNAVLNTTVTGNSDSTATLIVENTNTY